MQYQLQKGAKRVAPLKAVKLLCDEPVFNGDIADVQMAMNTSRRQSDERMLNSSVLVDADVMSKPSSTLRVSTRASLRSRSVLQS